MRGCSHVCPVEIEESLDVTLSVSLTEFLVSLNLLRRSADLMSCGLNH